MMVSELLQRIGRWIDLIDVNIFHLDKNYNLKEKIISKKVNIKDNNWKLEEVEIFSQLKEF